MRPSVFVSFSMPPDELEAAREGCGGTHYSVYPGMVNGDMRATANAVAGLVKRAIPRRADRPDHLRKYNITAVPVVRLPPAATSGDRLVISGDLTYIRPRNGWRRRGLALDTARNLAAWEVQ
ncbi:hypothetical protein KCP76_26155 (plasmid) [Salmonella enterica subsp. enterica serovar Weltevreden]|nr:hypothetical protein KCP76_26155 [Salmonella enterica subsp. enterica serovar Weltevreden]QUI99511.1 hypothetical protein KCP74_25585 [Salmonella enterica subsp. enterica]QUJ01280.1 hypothetical protein KCP73_26895 [Salmonella enterica subsp. enterica]